MQGTNQVCNVCTDVSHRYEIWCSSIGVVRYCADYSTYLTMYLLTHSPEESWIRTKIDATYLPNPIRPDTGVAVYAILRYQIWGSSIRLERYCTYDVLFSLAYLHPTTMLQRPRPQRTHDPLSPHVLSPRKCFRPGTPHVWILVLSSRLQFPEYRKLLGAKVTIFDTSDNAWGY